MKNNHQPKLTKKQQTQLRDDIVAFLFAEAWPSVVRHFLGQQQAYYYCQWQPPSLARLIKGNYGKVKKGAEASLFYPHGEYYREGNYPVTIWNSGSQVSDPPLSWCDLDEVPRDQAEYLVGNGDPDEENLYVKGEDITDEELELKAKGWEYVRRTGPEDSCERQSELRTKLTQIVEERLDLLLTPAEVSI